MAKVVNKQKINFQKLPSPDRELIIIGTDEFEDILEETDQEFQRSLRSSLGEYHKGEVYRLEEIK